ncbi:hypothetical protein PYK79_49900 [Streptomyces sp. ID05-04B]|uniref:hypothetical protein n=1 Tax=Streptomyces sp. ID05-04B TaxID=3028661 RepID=UPI0029C4EF44|nr:hypothetical protein [Streptomyces sp. ID05-04B]MDX5569794.1 hypothetical protein [Streptomyces sp. ID05-04B]
MRHTTTVVVLAALLVLAGCSDSSSSDKPAVTASAAPVVSKAALYLADARQVTFTGTPPDNELLIFPPQWCAALGEGHSVEWLLGQDDLYPNGPEWGTAKPDAYGLVVAGVKAYCPASLPVVQDELRETGAY